MPGILATVQHKALQGRGIRNSFARTMVRLKSRIDRPLLHPHLDSEKSH